MARAAANWSPCPASVVTCTAAKLLPLVHTICVFTMIRTLALLVLASAVTADSATNYYSAGAKKVGEFKPPAPPASEIKHLKNVPGSKIPAPSDAAMGTLSFLETGAGSDGEGSAAGAGSDAVAQKVPHNWFGTGKFVAPAYSVATGEEECKVCAAMISAKRKIGKVSESNTEKKDLAAQFGCGGINKKFEPMCLGYMNYLNDCPSFIHDICHEDVGGSEKLRAPCPMHLTCYYCLRINPLHCIP